MYIYIASSTETKRTHCHRVYFVAFVNCNWAIVHRIDFFYIFSRFFRADVNIYSRQKFVFQFDFILHIMHNLCTNAWEEKKEKKINAKLSMLAHPKYIYMCISWQTIRKFSIECALSVNTGQTKWENKYLQNQQRSENKCSKQVIRIIYVKLIEMLFQARTTHTHTQHNTERTSGTIGKFLSQTKNQLSRNKYD